jgi:hypothetical protein
VPRRLLSLIYYIAPPGRASAFGTTLFVRDDGRACREGRHYGFEGFRAVKTVEFRPNRALVFARTDRPFHGVLPIPPGLPRRDTLLYEIAYPLCAGRVA